MIYDINIFKKRSKKGLQNRSRAFIIANVPSEHAGVAQLVEHVIGNDEVVSSNLITSSIEALPRGVLLFSFSFKTAPQQEYCGAGKNCLFDWKDHSKLNKSVAGIFCRNAAMVQGYNFADQRKPEPVTL